MIIKYFSIILQVCHGGDPEAALVTFQRRSQALACNRNPEPVFNKRFIKLFWHKKDNGEDRPEADTSSAEMPQLLQKLVIR